MISRRVWISINIIIIVNVRSILVFSFFVFVFLFSLLFTFWYSFFLLGKEISLFHDFYLFSPIDLRRKLPLLNKTKDTINNSIVMTNLWRYLPIHIVCAVSIYICVVEYTHTSVVEIQLSPSLSISRDKRPGRTSFP